MSQRQLGTGGWLDCDGGNCFMRYSSITQENKWESRTTNGNSLVATNSATQSLSANGTGLNDPVPLSDTVGRSVTYSSTTSGTTRTETYTLLDSNGSAKIYTITWNNVAARSPDNQMALTINVVTAIGLPNGRSYQFQYDGNGYLSMLTFPSGAYLRYTYFSDFAFAGNGWTGWNVATRNVYEGASEKTTTFTYNYTTDGSGYYTGPVISTTAVDPIGGRIIHNFDTSGRETRTDTQNSSGTLLKRIDRVWQSGSAGPFLASQTTTTGSYAFKNDFSYDSWNNMTSQIESEQGTAIRQITRTYLTSSPYSDAHILDRIATEQTSPSGQGAVAQTQWLYDTLSLVPRSGTIPGWVDPGTNPRANVTSIQKWLNTTNTWLAATQQYDVLGNAVTVTDSGGHATQTDFTDRFSDNISRNSFAYSTQTTDAGGFYVRSTYDFNTGLVKQMTDLLSRVTSTTYDLMNRTTQINYPDGGQTNYSYDDVTPSTTETKKVDNAGNVGRVTYIFDKLYRVTQKQTADPAGTIYADTQYDGKGRKSQTSNPYRSGETEVWTAFTYDAADRPTVTTNSDGSTIQYAYSNNQTTVTDEAGNQRRYTYDRYGHLTQVDEPYPTLSTPLTTSYTYNVLGKMTQSNQSGQIRTWAFDSLGRMTSQTLPESGTTTFAYNTDSLMTSKSDARGVTTTYAYNSVHRPTSQTYSDGTPSVTFNYDTANRRSQMTDGLGTVISGAPDMTVYAEQRFIVSRCCTLAPAAPSGRISFS